MQPQWIIEFEKRNGTEKVQVNGRLYYPNGAWRDNSGHDYAAWNDPDHMTNVPELEWWSNQLVYYRTRHRQVEDQFHQLKNNLSATIEGGYQPTEPQYDELKQVKAEVEKRATELRKIQDKIENHPTNVHKKQVEANRQKGLAEARQKLDGIKI